MNKWLQYADKACEKLPSLIEIENSVDMATDFRINPKLEALLQTIDKLRPEEPANKRGSKPKLQTLEDYKQPEL